MTCKVSIQPLIVKQPIWVFPGGSGSEIPEKSTASRTAKNLGVGGSWGQKKKKWNRTCDHRLKGEKRETWPREVCVCHVFQFYHPASWKGFRILQCLRQTPELQTSNPRFCFSVSISSTCWTRHVFRRLLLSLDNWPLWAEVERQRYLASLLSWVHGRCWIWPWRLLLAFHN